MKIYSLLISLMLFWFFFPVPTQASPQIDGVVTDNEWDGAELHVIELTTGIEVNLSIIYTVDTVYYLAAIDHSKSVNEINLDPSEPHDYFGIEFDNNKDDAIMGTEFSPDDTIMVNYEENNGADMFMHSYKAFYDVDNGGINDVRGRAGTDGSNLFFEIEKPMTTNDDRGHDFDLIPGEEYQIMIAFWDDQPPSSATAGFNIRVDNEQFLTLTVNATTNLIGLEIVSIVVFLSCIAFGFYLSKYGTTSFANKFKQKLGN